MDRLTGTRMDAQTRPRDTGKSMMTYGEGEGREERKKRRRKDINTANG